MVNNERRSMFRYQGVYLQGSDDAPQPAGRIPEVEPPNCVHIASFMERNTSCASSDVPAEFEIFLMFLNRLCEPYRRGEEGGLSRIALNVQHLDQWSRSLAC